MSQSELSLGRGEEADRFRLLLDKTARILKEQARVKSSAYGDSQLLHYRSLSLPNQQKALRDVETYCEILSEITDSGWSLKDDKRSLWVALKHFGLTPTSDVFNFLTEEHALEVYSFDGIQLWRNIRFMEVCSYTLEEIFCYTWEERYERTETAIREIGFVLQQIASQPAPQTVKTSIHNVLKEKFGSEKYVIDVHHNFGSPVMSGHHKIVGFIVGSKAEIIGRGKEVEPQRSFNLNLVSPD